MTHNEDDHLPISNLPRFLHGLEPAHAGPSDVADPRERADVVRWRQAARQRLMEDRLAIPGDTRRKWDARIATNLEEAIGDVTGLIIGVYRPIRGEPDLDHVCSSSVPLHTLQAWRFPSWWRHGNH